MDRYLETIFLTGVICFALASLFVLILMVSKKARANKAIWRCMLILWALAIMGMAGPAVYTRFAPIDLGPHQQFVAGERHITLTGWDRKDYSVLSRMPDVVVLQMANPDVSDEDVGYLKELAVLRELDLGSTKITDASLATLAVLPSLQILRINNTAVTTAGFEKQATNFPKLRQLDVRGTAIDVEVLKKWKAAKEGRRYIGP